MAGNVSVKQLERQADALAGKVEKQVARVEKAKAAWQEARGELARLEAEQRENRARLSVARKAAAVRHLAPSDESE